MNEKTDKLPPYSHEAEQGLLGSIILDPIQASLLKPEWFYDLRHKKIAQALVKMADEGRPIDPVTITAYLKDQGIIEQVGGLAYVSTLPDMTPSGMNWTYFQGILEEKYMLRRMIQHGTEFAERAFEPGENVQELLDEFEQRSLAIRDSIVADQDPNLKAQMKEVVNELEACFEAQGRLRGLTSGFSDLDRITNGFREGQFILIAARPSVGKTSLAMNIAERLAVDDGVPVGVMSLEMSARELLFRMSCCRARVDSDAATKGRISEKDIQGLMVACSQINKAPLHVIDSPGLTIGRIAAVARRLVQRYGIKMLIIDYLQIVRASRKFSNRAEEVAFISGHLKMLARELGIPVLVIAQLSREVDKDNRKPRLSDLRESGSLEQDADIVIFLNRDVEDAVQYSETQKIELTVAKNRHGRVDVVDMIFLKNITRFEQAARTSAEEVAQAYKD